MLFSILATVLGLILVIVYGVLCTTWAVYMPWIKGDDRHMLIKRFFALFGGIFLILMVVGIVTDLASVAQMFAGMA